MSRELLLGTLALWAFAAGAQPAVTPVLPGPVKPIAPVVRPGPVRQQVGTDRDQCIAAAKRQLDLPQRALKLRESPEARERRFQIALASCAGPDVSPERAAVVGAMNIDYRELALRFLGGELSGAEYKAAVDDRTRKNERARTDAAFRAALAAGDADRDFIPDAQDRCANTPALRPTDDSGCPIQVPPTDPRQDTALGFLRMLDSQKIMLSTACTGAAAPTTPAFRRYGRGATGSGPNQTGFKMAVSRVANQPAKCPVFYELSFRFSNPSRTDIPRDTLVTVSFRDTEATAAPDAREQFFLATATGEGKRGELFTAFGQYFRAQVQVRAYNGDGATSGWSEIRDAKLATGGL